VDRTRLWPDFRDEWIVEEDDTLLFIDKPTGISSQAADPERPDDIVTRLKRYLAARGSDSYLGTHQRLDRDTSGLLVYARKKEANASLAPQFEGRSAKKMYIACISGWKKNDAVSLRDRLAPGDGDKTIIAKDRDKRGVMAVTHVKVRARQADRALVEVELETGRTHQARAQLAHAGSPIAGDIVYGGPPAPRLLLHAHALEITHPKTNKKIRIEAKIPADFQLWLERGDLGPTVYDEEAAIDRTLARAMERRWGLARSTGKHETTAFRLVNEAGDGLPGLSVDVYGDFLVAQVHADSDQVKYPIFTEERRVRILDRLHALGFDGIYLKLRPRQANTLVDTRREDIAPKDPVRGTAAPESFLIREDGIDYEARLGDGLSTGIFLDQRANRARVRSLSKDARVANLFSYTCPFTVAAAAGGAKETVSVDASAASLERGAANVARLGLVDNHEARSPEGRSGVDMKKHQFVADDAFNWLARQKTKFDLIILDPPSYATTKTRRFVASTDYVELAAQAIALLAPKGKLLACTNHRGIRQNKFRHMLQEAVQMAKRSAAQVKDLPDPSDFPAPPGGEHHLKSVLVTLK
jgi:23S rRNA (cytosine1962-C5)-methyltransferase